MSAFNWVLLSFPIYLFVNGKFVKYLKFAGK
jgi:hypothetical protein